MIIDAQVATTSIVTLHLAKERKSQHHDAIKVI
jgi:hypothetical protein